MAASDSPTEIQLQSRLAHLTMVQGIIGRIAGYSAAVKNFNLTIAAALIAVAFDKTLVGLLLAGAGITVVFALLDAYYLSLEKRFRECYATISARPWSEAFDLSITQRPTRRSDVFRSMQSVSVWGFYAPLLGGVLLLAYLLSYVQPDPPKPTSALGLLGLMSQPNALSPRRSSTLLSSLMTAHPNALLPPPSSPVLGLLSIPNALSPTAPKTESPGSALGVGMSSLFGMPYRPGAGSGTILGDAMRAASVKRRVFFSFHYQRDINRVNIVRKSSQFRPEDGTEPADWFDHSIWETAKKTGQAALKRLIHGGMERSSVTCVLAGTETWGRPWVRYEIAYGLARGNGLLTVFIDGLQCMKNGFCYRGPNPLDYLGLKWDGQGKAHIWENFGGQWRRYPLYTEAVSWPKWLPNVTETRFIQPLSRGAAAYDYSARDGYANLGRWTHTAAQQAGR